MEFVPNCGCVEFARNWGCVGFSRNPISEHKKYFSQPSTESCMRGSSAMEQAALCVVSKALWAENTYLRDMKQIACGLERFDPSIWVHFYPLMTEK